MLIEETLQENPFIKRFEEFFKTNFKKEVEKLAAEYPEKKSLIIDFKELEKFDYELADELLENPDYLIEAAEFALQEIEIPNLHVETFEPKIRFYNLPKDREFDLKEINANLIGKLIVVEGIIRQITDVLPKLKIGCFQCRRCGKIYYVKQDSNKVKQPGLCECKHKDFQLVTEKSIFIDYQKIQIQEPLEKLRGNEQPTTLDVYVAEDLVNKVSAGDRVKFIGILRLQKPKEHKVVYGRILDVNFLEETEKEFAEIEITPEDEKKIKELAKDKRIYEKFVNSIAPAIYGHEIVKEAIVLQLFGGVKKLLPNNASIRGNIHIMLVGDPGIAKSMLLQAANRIAPKSIYVGGKTTSGVGLAAAAVRDDFGEGGWTLKAGALVLASGGLAMIDEFEKMDAEDRSAMHEAMEQGRISVAKAGIVATFKTDTSILAAANPKYGRFDQYESFIKQIDLPPSLVSRFDLFFPMRDVLDRVKDSEIANHILKTHKVGEMLMNKSEEEIEKLLKKSKNEELKNIIKPEIDIEMIKKYISYARQKVFPVLTNEAMKAIADFYLELRDLGRKEGTYAATHRQLEAIIRLSEASARVRLSNKVELQDVERAIKLIKKSLEEIAVDKETGQIDIDIITSGQSHSQVNTMKRVLQIISELYMELNSPVSMQKIIESCEKENIDIEKAKEAILNLKKKGDLYEPKHGFFKPIQL